MSRAFTLTEMLVVLAILGLVVAIVSAGSPAMFARAGLNQAAARLAVDLGAASMRARRDGAFGALESGSDGQSYAIRIGEVVILRRTLPHDVHIEMTPNRVAIDPVGRLAPAHIVLDSDYADIAFSIDPLTGAAHRQSPRARHRLNGNARRRRHTRFGGARFLVRASRGARRSRARKRSGAGRGAGERLTGGSAPDLAFRSTCGAKGRTGLDATLCGGAGSVKSASLADSMQRDDCTRWQRARRARHPGNSMGGATAVLAPAMTLVELMVALVIMGLMSAFAFSSMGAWLAQGQISATESAFWRAATPAQIALSDLTVGAVDPASRRVSPHEARFRTLAPRLSPVPIDVALRIESRDPGSRLLYSTPGLNTESAILAAPAPLRFSATARDRLVLEMRRGGGQWEAIAVADFVANGPLTCAFDLISRDCR